MIRCFAEIVCMEKKDEGFRQGSIFIGMTEVDAYRI